MNSFSSKISDITRREWQELGFYYEYLENEKKWKFIGDKKGLLKFASLLKEYCSDPRNTKVSEHEHFGPYYLKVMTYHYPDITDDCIAGTLKDIQRLSDEIKRKSLESTPSTQSFEISKSFAEDSDHVLSFHVVFNDFDPSRYDINIKSHGEDL